MSGSGDAAGLVQRTTSAVRTEVRLATPADRALLARFYREAWQSDSSPEAVERAWRAGEALHGYPPLISLALVDGRVVAYCGTIPFMLWRDGSLRKAHWLKGLMVLPEVQRGPLGFHVLRNLAGSVGESGGIAVADAAVRLFTALGYRDIGVLPDMVRPLRPARIIRLIPLEMVSDRGALVALSLRVARLPVLSAVAGATMSIVLKLSAGRGRVGSAGQFLVSDGAPDPGEVDALWERIRGELVVAPARDAGTMAARYAPAAASEHALYTGVMLRERGSLVAVAMVRRPGDSGDPRLGGIKVATLSDALFSPSRADVAAALCNACADVAMSLGADAIVAAASHPSLQNALRATAYLPVAGRLHVLWRASDASAKPAPLDNWWLCRGDCGADDAF